MANELKLIEDNIIKALDALQEFTATPGCGVTRFPYSKEARDACSYLKKLMEAVGLAVRMDNSGAVIGRLEGKSPATIMIGSHVDVIVGIKRARIRINGRADHAGTMPMHMRKDALEQATKVISKIGDRARLFRNCVATVGYLQVEPNVMNIIPQSVTFVVDIRGVDEETIMTQYYSLLADLDKMSLESGLTYDVENLLYAEPVRMDEEIKGHFEMSCIERQYDYMHLPSGAGHDAQIFGSQLPAAMLFVPSAGGRSHCPEEKSEAKDLAKAVLVAYDALQTMCELM